MNVDLIASIVCGVTATAMFSLFCITDPKAGLWLNWPLYVRLGLWAGAAMLMIRSVNLTNLSGSGDGAGHMNIEALGLQIAFAYLFLGLLFWAVRRSFPVAVWHRLRWVEQVHRDRGPDFAPVMLPVEDVVDAASMLGVTAAQPGASTVEYLEHRRHRRPAG